MLHYSKMFTCQYIGGRVSFVSYKISDVFQRYTTKHQLGEEDGGRRLLMTRLKTGIPKRKRSHSIFTLVRHTSGNSNRTKRMVLRKL